MKSRQATPRRGIGFITTGLAAWLGLVASPALAQQAASADRRPARIYAGAAGLFTTQPGTSLGEQSGDTPLEGSGLAFSALFGAGGRLSVEGQVTRGPLLEGFVDFHISGGTATYTTSFRDTLVSAFVRYRGSPSSRILVEPVAGVTLAFGRGTKAYAFVPEATGQPEFPSEEELRRRSLGLGGGLDLLVPAGRRVSLGGGFRVHRLLWKDESRLDVPNLGLGRWILQAGAEVRVDLMGAPAASAAAGTAAARAGDRWERPRGYVGGFAGLFSQPVGEVDGHYLTEGVGGNGFGFGGTAGAFIHRHWSVAAEVSVGPEFEARSFFAGRIQYDTRYRDTLFSGVFRWHPAASTPVRVEPVFGVTVAAAHVPRTATWIVRFNSAGEPTDATIDRVGFGAVGGADLVTGGKSLAAVASFRAHAIDRNDTRDDQPPELGVGRFVYVVAGGLRWTF